jgi:hypothetical protein
MAVREKGKAADTATPQFTLEHFDWTGPDRLEVRGTFHGIAGAGNGLAVLIVHSDDGTHQLPAAGDQPPPVDGEPWDASFAWQEVPTAFTRADLLLGDDLVIALPDVGDGEAAAGPLPVSVRGAPGRPAGLADLRLEARLLAAQEDATSLRRELERAHESLARSVADLDMERSGRAEDSQRFRVRLEEMEAAMAEALEHAQTEVEAAAGARSALAEAATEMEQLLDRLRAASGGSRVGG